MMRSEKVKEFLDKAQEYADRTSQCKKVAVGAVIVPHDMKVEIYGANICYPMNCKTEGCRRIALYGEDSKNHRLPSDCRSLHSEIDAITQAAKFGISIRDAKLFVTRYPCEACARAIVNAGIREVYYGREQEISEETERIFSSNHVMVYHENTWNYIDTRR